MNQPDPHQPTQQQMSADLLKISEDVLCEECESRFFTQVCCVKKISALLAPSGVETRIPVYTLQCTSCGHINKDFLPPISS
jgi:ribosomal protein L33